MKRSTQWVTMVVVASVALLGGEAFAGKRTTKKAVTGVLNLNTATAQQLDLLPGVGPAAAKRIIDYRAQHPFAQVDELRKVKGFGKKKLEKLRPHLAVQGATTLKQVKAGEAGAPAAPTDEPKPAQARSAPKPR